MLNENTVRRGSRIGLAVTATALTLGLAACDPYSPGQRAVGGGLLGAGAGAAIGGLAGGFFFFFFFF